MDVQLLSEREAHAGDHLVQEIKLGLLILSVASVELGLVEETPPETRCPNRFRERIMEKPEWWPHEIFLAELRLGNEGAERLLGFLDPRRSDLLSKFKKFSLENAKNSENFNIF